MNNGVFSTFYDVEHINKTNLFTKIIVSYDEEIYKRLMKKYIKPNFMEKFIKFLT